jgi:YidC/Oxa1 family membrane protein insertase
VSPTDLLSPAISAVYAVITALAPALPGPLGAQLLLALALITLLVRALLLPLSLHGHRRRQAAAALAPQLERVRRKHRNEPERLARELKGVYSSAGVSPFAGMGSAVLQSPLLVTLYGVATTAQVAGATNVLVSTQLLGTPLSARFLPALVSAPGVGPALVLLAVLHCLVLVAWLASRRQQEGPRALKAAPFITVAIALGSPVALSAYLLSSSAWSLAERIAFQRWA